MYWETRQRGDRFNEMVVKKRKPKNENSTNDKLENLHPNHKVNYLSVLKIVSHLVNFGRKNIRYSHVFVHCTHR